MKKHGPWKTKNTKMVFESPWIRVDHSEVINPGGGEVPYISKTLQSELLPWTKT